MDSCGATRAGLAMEGAVMGFNNCTPRWDSERNRAHRAGGAGPWYGEAAKPSFPSWLQAAGGRPCPAHPSRVLPLIERAGLPLLAGAMEPGPAYVAVASGGDWVLCYRRSPCNCPQDDWDLQAAQGRQGGPAPGSLLQCLWLSGSTMKGIRRFRASPAPSPGRS